MFIIFMKHFYAIRTSICIVCSAIHTYEHKFLQRDNSEQGCTLYSIIVEYILTYDSK